MVSNNENKTRSLSSVPNDSFPDIIEVSSDSEKDVFHQPYLRGNKHPESTSWQRDVIELTDSESSSSDFPDTLSPLVRGPRTKKNTGSRKFQPGCLTLYVDTSDDESDKDCILVSNDPRGSARPIREVPPAKDVAKCDPSFGSPKKDTAPVFSQSARNLPSNIPVQKVKEQARRQQYATELFAELNKVIFCDRLPKSTTLEWSKRLLTTAGRARWHRSRAGVDTTKIELASKILDCDERIRNTLSHEMCHLACWIIDNRPREGHGQLFKSWAKKVMGKYPNIHISTRHNYEISYPYEWECEKCMKIYGRYSESIRPDECVCGACKMGKLIPLFVERKAMAPKVSRLAVVKPRDSLHLHSRNTDDNDITSILMTLRDMSMTI